MANKMSLTVVVNVETTLTPEEVMDVVNFHLNVGNFVQTDVDLSAVKFLSAVDVTTDGEYMERF